MPARLVIIGSGETSPTLIKVHRQLLNETREPVMLDTSFGFQANADDLTDKIGTYFRESVGTALQPARWRSANDPLLDRERTLSLLTRSDFVFAGPGSPSYALRQWSGTPVPDALLDLVQRGGTLMMGSAAAVTLGALAIPVYEIYKVGDEPHWLPGLNLLGQLTGLQAAVIPHYDNKEGGRHDTRYCYLGESRIDLMEMQLPEDVNIFGVDEHTAVIIDLEDNTVAVQGAGGFTLRRDGISEVLPSGSVASLIDVRDLLTGAGGSTPGQESPTLTAPISPSASVAPDDSALSLLAFAAERKLRFDSCLIDGDADGALAACLELEDSIHAWSADTLQSDDIDQARRTLRAMLVDLATAATNGLRDSRHTLGPVVDVVLAARAKAREVKDFAMSDLLRDGLHGAGIEVRDTPAGTEWEIRSED